jgi:hopanoid biosynthesis associated RND transporter like protein HpnN
MLDSGREAVTSRWLRKLTGLILGRPAWSLACALMVAAASVAFAAVALRFKPNRADLLNPTSTYHKRWLQYVKEFGPNQDLIVVAESDDAAEAAAALDDVAAAIGARPDLFGSAFTRLGQWPPPEKAVLYLPKERIRWLSEQLDQYEPLLEGHWSLLNLPDIYENLRLQIAPDVADAEAARSPADSAATTSQQFVQRAGTAQLFSEALIAYLENPRDYRPQQTMPLLAPWLAVLERFSAAVQAPVAPPERLQLFVVRPAATSEHFSGQTETVDALRAIAADVRLRHPGVQLGLTGLPVLESDEMRSSQGSMTTASILSLLGVSLLFVVGFRGWRYPLLATFTLAVGVAWSFGFVTLAIGHLNILSMAFSIILIGLGIDYSIHYLAHYMQQRRLGIMPEQAVLKTVERIGPGLVTSALTTSIAFFMAWQTKFLGVAELGVIVGGGIILCLLATLVVLPALVVLSDRRRHKAAPAPPVAAAVVLAPLQRHPVPVIAVLVLATVGLGVLAPRVRYDHNLLNLQPVGLESVRWQKRMVEASNRSVWSAVSIAGSPEEVRLRKARFLEKPTISEVEEIASLFPEDQQSKLALLASMQRRLNQLPEEAPLTLLVDPRGLTEQILRLRRALAPKATGPTPDGKAAAGLLQTLQRLTQSLALLPASAQHERINGFQQRVMADLVGRLRTLRTVVQTKPVTIDDVPAGLQVRFISPGGKWLLRVYARNNVWEMEALDRFVADVLSVDPHATGSPLQTYYASHDMKASYENAALYALAAIIVVLWLSFRSHWIGLLALVPVAVGLVMLLGTLQLLGIDLNPANMIVLPLILGIGVDNGVHVLHDFRRQRRNYRITPSTACAVLLTSLTTMIGFGTLTIAEHRGVRSLGIVLVIGVGLCLLASLALLPAMLSWVSARRQHRRAVPPPPADESDAQQKKAELMSSKAL